MTTPPLLTATPSGDMLELRPAGSWTAANVKSLEVLFHSITAQLDRSEDRQGGYDRRARTRHAGSLAARENGAARHIGGPSAEMVGVADKYVGLIEEVRQVNRHNPAPAPARKSCDDQG